MKDKIICVIMVLLPLCSIFSDDIDYSKDDYSVFFHSIKINILDNIDDIYLKLTEQSVNNFVESEDLDNDFLVFSNEDLAFKVFSDDSDKLITHIEFLSDKISTNRGIRIGDNKKGILEKYNIDDKRIIYKEFEDFSIINSVFVDGVISKDAELTKNTLYQIDYLSLTIRFNFTDDLITKISIYETYEL